VKVISAALEIPTTRWSSQAPPSPGIIPIFHEALGKDCVFAGEPNVAHASEVEAGTDRGSVDGGDEGNLRVVQRKRDTMHPFFVGIALVDRRYRTALGTLAHLLDVAAGAKSLSDAGEDRGADALVALNLPGRRSRCRCILGRTTAFCGFPANSV
jgi:hypothetical protein